MMTRLGYVYSPKENNVPIQGGPFCQKDKTSVFTQRQGSFAWLDLGKVARGEGHGIHVQQVIL